MASTTVTLTLRDKFSAGINKFNSGMNQMKSSLNKVKSSFSNAQRNMSKTGSSVSQINTVVGKSPSLFSRLASAVSGSKTSLNGFNGVIQKSQSLFKRFTSGLSGMIGALTGLSIFRTITGWISGSMDTALNRLDTIDRFYDKMELLTGDVNNAEYAISSLKDSTTGTAYALDTASKAVQNFVTRGLDTERAVASTELWMDAVATFGKGTDEEFATATDAIAKMRTKGTVEMKQLNRLFQIGINPVQIYADAVGTSARQVQDALSDKKLKSEQFITVIEDALRNGTNGVVNVTGQAQQAGKTWQGTLNNFRIAIARGVANVVDSTSKAFAGIFGGEDVLKEKILNTGKWIESLLGKSTDNGFTGFAGIIERDLPTILTHLKSLGTVFKEEIVPSIKTGGQEIYAIFKNTLIPVMLNLASVATLVFGKVILPSVNLGIKVFGKLAEKVSPIINGLSKEITEFANGFDLNNKFQDFDTLSKKLKAIDKVYSRSIDKSFNNGLEKLDISSIGNKFSEVFSNLTNTIGPKAFAGLLRIISIIATTFDNISGTIHDSTIKMIEFTGAVANFVLPPTIEAIVRFFGKISAFTTRITNENLPKLTNAFERWGTQAKQALETYAPSLAKMFGGLVDNGLGIGANLISKFVDMVIALGDAVVAHLPEIISFFEKITELTSKLITKSGNNVSGIFDFITNNADNLITVFSRLIPLALAFVGAFKVYNLPFIQALKTGVGEIYGLFQKNKANKAFNSVLGSIGQVTGNDESSQLASGASSFFSNKNDVIIARLLGVISTNVQAISRKMGVADSVQEFFAFNKANDTKKGFKTFEELTTPLKTFEELTTPIETEKQLSFADILKQKQEELKRKQAELLKKSQEPKIIEEQLNFFDIVRNQEKRNRAQKLIDEKYKKSVYMAQFGPENRTHSRTRLGNLFGKTKEKLGNGTDKVFGGIEKGANKAGNAISKMFAPLKSGLSQMKNNLGQELIDLKAWFLDIIPDSVIEGFLNFGSVLSGLWAGPLSTLLAGFGVFAVVLAPVVIALMALGVQASQVDGFFSSLNDTVTNLGKSIQTWLTGFFNKLANSDWLVNMAQYGAELMVSLMKGIVMTALNLIGVAGNIAITFVAGLMQSMPNIVNAGFEFVGNLIVGVFRAIPELFQKAIDIVFGWAGLIISYAPELAKSGAQLLINLISGIVKWVPKAIWEFIKMLGNLGMVIIKNLPTFIALGIRLVGAILQGMWNFAKGIGSWVYGIYESIIEWAKNIDWGQIGRDIRDGILGGVGYIFSGQWINDIADWVKGGNDKADELSQKGKEMGQSYTEGFNQGASENLFDTSGLNFSFGSSNLNFNSAEMANGITDNFNQTINDNTQTSVDTIANYANNVGTSMDNAMTQMQPQLDAHSRQLGVSMVEQISSGILSQKGLIADALKKAFDITSLPFRVISDGSLKGLKSFDVGTKFVPNDMIAQIHKGEAIIPANQNPFNSSGTAIPFNTPTEQESYKVDSFGTTNKNQTQNNDNRNITYAPTIIVQSEEVGNTVLEDMERFFNQQLENDIQTMSMA